MEGRKVKDSSTILSQVMQPQDANIAGNVHGGVIMKLIDNAAGVACVKHAKTNVVTASIDRLSFHHPVFVGDLMSLRASLNMVGKSSMEVGVRVETENVLTGITKHIASAYLTFVALDANGKPTNVPPLVFESDEEKRRNEEANDRRRIRVLERIKEEEHQKVQTTGNN